MINDNTYTDVHTNCHIRQVPLLSPYSPSLAPSGSLSRFCMAHWFTASPTLVFSP